MTDLAGREQRSTARDRLRVLFVACHLPYPTISGGRKREFELVSRLGPHADVDLAVVSKTYEEDVANAHHLEAFCRSVDIFPAEPPAERDPSLPWQVQRHRSPGLTRFVAERVDHVDLVHLEGYYLEQHLPPQRQIPAILVEQNVEYLLCKQQLETARGQDRQIALLDYLKSLEAETAAWRGVDRLGAVTEEDASYIRKAAPGLEVTVVPDGLDAPRAAEPHPGMEGPTLAFVANFGYAPNVDAALFLCRKIVPLVARNVPDVKLWLVGNAPPPEVRRLASDHVVVTGRVPSVDPYIAGADVITCPLRIGGGIKVKVLEALAHGKAIVTTPIGTQGIASDIPAIVHDDPARLAGATITLLNDPGLRRRLEREALSFARGLPTWDEAAHRLLDLYDQAVSGTRTRRPASVG